MLPIGVFPIEAPPIAANASNCVLILFVAESNVALTLSLLLFVPIPLTTVPPFWGRGRKYFSILGPCGLFFPGLPNPTIGLEWTRASMVRGAMPVAGSISIFLGDFFLYWPSVSPYSSGHGDEYRTVMESNRKE